MFSHSSLGWLRERVSAACPSLTSDDWGTIRPNWSEPYDDADVDEVVGRFVRLYGTSARRRRRRTKKTLMQKQPTSLPPRRRWLFIRPMLQDWRERQGFLAPVKLEELRSTLISLGATAEKKAVRDRYGWHGLRYTLAYPSAIKVLGSIATMSEIEQVYFSVHDLDLVHLKGITDLVAHFLHCHPALALAAWLCDAPVHDNVSVIFEGHTLRLEIADVHAVQPESVMRAYSLGQQEILNLKGDKVSRRRGRDRTRALWVYPHITPGLTWEQRWAKWNSAHPEWEYSDPQTMVSAYSRVKRRKEADRAWLEGVERRLAISAWELGISSAADIGKKDRKEAQGETG